MKYNKLIRILLVTGAMVFLSGCNKESKSNKALVASTSSANGFSCTIDGTSFVGTSVVSSNITKFTAPTYAMDGKRLDIRATNSAGEMIILTLVDYRDGTIGDSFRIGKHFFNFEENPIVGTVNGTPVKGVSNFNIYSSGFAFLYSSALENNSVGSNVDLVSIDVTNKKISGTFSGTLEHIDGTIFTVANGVFNDLSYVVM